jgi:beta-ureidopropionase
MQSLHAACIQTPPGGVATPAYVDELLRGADRRIDLAVLPELSTVPYFPLEPDSLDAATPVAIDDPSIAEFGDVARAHACYLMLGLHMVNGGRGRNSAVLIGADGRPAAGRTRSGVSALSYDKVHLCDTQMPPMAFCESSYFAPGDGYVVWDTPMACVAALICYDRHFPEAWVAVREMGAEVVCVCTTSPVTAEASFIPEMQGMALQQNVYALVANRVGEELLRTSGVRSEFLGASCIVAPTGAVLAAAPAAVDVSIVTARLTPEPLVAMRSAHQFHEHRRPDTYLRAR